MGFKLPQVKATGPLLWWGRFRFMFGHAAFYMSAVSIALLAPTAYNTTIREWVLDYFGWDMPFLVFMVVLVFVIIFGIILEYVVSVPAIIAVSNEQMYKHESPIDRDFKAVKAKQKEDGEKIDLIMKHLGIMALDEDTDSDRENKD